ncbi:LysM peptidoglycan-binding domain-containing protein [Limosilactobacillus sp. STM2_1]|uniref:LysM peptidoglycan-binding domain-containing protein n=1 Tax=Limosilactobacillus rudii TaxID=2759755 RepID=A0A7W3ULE9_9LACO|nr:C40 family peptidase [Limosilactobacillus rudii]MBB1078570.1 LysM peptidoglycan-binding domain-containing protein [Limosilactobacillus rudii]MBB1097210.1 LysM peptidoglycan-binding domain-containing protein [Limosilactobacillus rudii]MCD7133874.1 LysM peptidoglycan-binding domain-containing protein [Limosilactobacillus rudii]
MVKKAHHSTNHRSRGVVTGAISALSLLAVSTQAVNAEQLTVKAGDTIWGIAKQHGLSVSALEQANPSVKKLSDSIDLITVGQQLTLPSSQQNVNTALNADGSYTVQPGDTLSSIAGRYNISVSQLMSWNSLTSSDSLYIGQHLSVTGPVANTAPTVMQPAASQSTTVNANAAQPITSVAPQSTVPAQSTSQVASATAQVPGAFTANSASQADPVSAVNSTTPVSASTGMQNTTAASSAETASATVASVTPAVVSTSSSAALQTTVATTSQFSAQPTSSAAASVNTASQTSEGNNTAALYTQSFVQTTPVASQSVQAQQPAPASQTSAAPQSTVQQQQAPVSQAQPQQSQVSQPVQQQPATNASADLQHGSVVSLATKIANSNSVPYVWGGENLSGMDCSGLVKYVYANAEGKQLPHYTGALENCVDQHPVSQAKPGDLLFWGNHGSTYHTAIYTGNNQYVAAAKPGTNVATYTISPYFNPSFAGTVK